MKAFLLSAAYMLELRNAISHAKSDDQLFKAIVNAPFNTVTKGLPLGLSIIVLLLVDDDKKSVKRIALADTESAKGAVEYSVKKFHEITIPLNNPTNSIVKAIRSNEHQVITDWQYLFTPDLTPEEARFNQAGAGIATSIVYPLEDTRNGGAIIFSYVLNSNHISDQYHDFMQKYIHLVSKKLRH
jgi:hypothetical protein